MARELDGGGAAWCDVARRLAETARVPLHAIRLGRLDGDYRDPRCTWVRHREITPWGAVLVRPDRYLGWRSLGSRESSSRRFVRSCCCSWSSAPGSHPLDVSALAQQSFGIDTTAAWTADAFAVLIRALLERGLIRRST